MLNHGSNKIDSLLELPNAHQEKQQAYASLCQRRMLTHKTSKEKAFEVSSSGKHNSSVSVLLLQSRGKKMHCLSRGGSGTRYMVFSYSKWNMFQQASSDLFASACPLTLLSSKEKREADSSQRLFILLSVSFFLK